MRVPAGWQVDDQGEAVSCMYDSGSGDIAVFVLARDPAYTADLALDEVLRDVLARVGAEADSLSVEDADARTIAGVKARGASKATDEGSGLEMTGYVYQMVKAGKDYAWVGAATLDTWDAHQPEIDAIAASIRLGATADEDPHAQAHAEAACADP